MFIISCDPGGGLGGSCLGHFNLCSQLVALASLVLEGQGKPRWHLW